MIIAVAEKPIQDLLYEILLIGKNKHKCRENELYNEKQRNSQKNKNNYCKIWRTNIYCKCGGKP